VSRQPDPIYGAAVIVAVCACMLLVGLQILAWFSS
jgi:hypothetical protein